MGMQELISLANGIDEEDVEITLRQGSLIIDATVSMPTAAGIPAVPTGRAVGRVLRDTTGQDVTIDAPRMARRDAEDELWRTTANQESEDSDTEWPRPQDAGARTRKHKLLNRLDFAGAKAHARKVHNDLEERLARSQLTQPDMSPDMEEWLNDREHDDDDDMRMKYNPWNLVPDRQL